MPVYGRDPQCDVVVDSDACSWRHAATTHSASGVVIEDLGSTNGTLVNGVRVRSAVLSEGDVVVMGDRSFVFASGRLESSAAVGKSRRRPRFAVFGGLLAALGLLLAGSLVVILSNQSRMEAPISEEVQSPPTESSQDLFSAPAALGSLVDRASSAVVSLECGGSTGSGWPLRVGDEVLIVTNHHVVSDCINSSVRLSTASARSSASVLGSDAITDLAVLRTPAAIDALEIAEPPPVGAWLMVVGNPLGMERSVSYGTLNNILDGLLITDAAINPGNSGGPVFDSLGRVVGTASAKISSDEVDRLGLVMGVAGLCEAVLECSGAIPG